MERFLLTEQPRRASCRRQQPGAMRRLAWAETRIGPAVCFLGLCALGESWAFVSLVSLPCEEGEYGDNSHPALSSSYTSNTKPVLGALFIPLVHPLGRWDYFR